MVANMVATPAGKFGSGMQPWLGSIDGGKKFRDAKPILGKGKTWAGLIGGVLAAGLYTVSIGVVNKSALVPASWLLLGVVIGFGALSFDILKSFLKRRLGFGSDSCLPVIDQLDFLIGAACSLLLLTQVLKCIPAESLYFKLTPLGFSGLCLLMLFLHPAVNLIAFKMGWKRVPF